MIMQRPLTNDESLQQAKSRWTETLSAFKRSMSLEAKVVENTTEDGDVLGRPLCPSPQLLWVICKSSRRRNELVGLSVKQQLQLQNMLAADQRAQSLERARNLASQEEARLQVQRPSPGTAKPTRPNCIKS